MVDAVGGAPAPKLTEKEILARAEVNKSAQSAHVRGVIEAGSTIDKDGNLTAAPVKYSYDAKFYKSGDPGTFRGAPGLLCGLVAEKDIKPFKTKMIEDTYLFARAVGFHFSSLDQLDIKCGIKLLNAFPAALKESVHLSTDMQEYEFVVTLKLEI